MASAVVGLVSSIPIIGDQFTHKGLPSHVYKAGLGIIDGVGGAGKGIGNFLGGDGLTVLIYGGLGLGALTVTLKIIEAFRK